jgi:protocatechuate 3,4-dioxygenase beta subunit
MDKWPRYTRRESLQLVGMGIAASALPHWAGAVEICTLEPELTVGPFYVDVNRVRRDITEGKPGVPLLLRVQVLNARDCSPVRKAVVNVWHCDARGYYSGYTGFNPDIDLMGQGPAGQGGREGGPTRGPGGPPLEGPPPGGPGGSGDRQGGPPGGGAFTMPTTDQLTFLRGVQFTGKDGVAEFRSIYPGWYFERATHIHLKVHTGSTLKGQRYEGGHVCHVGQLGFDDQLNDRIAIEAPYRGRSLIRTLNTDDSVFTERSLATSLVKVRARKPDYMSGLIADAAVMVDPDATPSPVGGGGRARVRQIALPPRR